LPLLLCLCAYAAKAQDTSLQQLPAAYLSKVSARVEDLKGDIDRKSQKAIAQLQKQEEKIKRKLSRIDSSKAKEVFGSAEDKYKSLQQKLENPRELTSYIPYLDTLKTSLKFLQSNKQYFADIKAAEGKLGQAAAKVKDLQSSLAKAENIKAFIKERKTYLKQQLGNLPFSKELKKLNKQAYYYSAQIAEYKTLLKDKKKLERKAVELLSKTKAFKDFMRRNSQLASLFRLPGSDDATGSASLAGLQTRAQVNQLIQDRIGTGANAQELFQQNIRDARSQLSQLKDKAAQYSSGSYGNSSGEIDIPEGFRANPYKTKSFFRRLEYGGNIQSQKARMMFPVTSDIGLSLGYKLNDKSVIGVGGSYKLGLGQGWNNMALSHQGLSVRSYADFKIKGSLFLSGGYEQNYRNEIRSIEALKNSSAWQASGLIGLSKKYKVSKKLKGNMQLLWDFLSYRQLPKTQAVLFRVGYSLK